MLTCATWRRACNANTEQAMTLCDVTTKLLVSCHIECANVYDLVIYRIETSLSVRS